MILARLEEEIARRAAGFAARGSLEPPGTVDLDAPPGHVSADASWPWPLAAARAARRKPLDIARELAEALRGIPELAAAEAAPPGFVNLRLTPAALYENMRAAVLRPEEYGREAPAPEKSILVEFVSANPTGPLHLASARAATLGDALVRIHRRLGWKAHAEYYVNDGGGRVELLGRSIQARFEQLRGRDAPLPEGGYMGEYLKELAARAPSEAASWDAKAWGRHAMDVLLASHKADMEAFGVRFDRWFLESELYAEGQVESTLEALRSRGMVYEKDGAQWLGTKDMEGSEDEKDRVLVRRDGKPTYLLPDLAYHRAKLERGYARLVDILGADHHGYVPRLKAGVAALGYDPGRLSVIVHQLVHLYRGAEAVKMSKRAGDFVPLGELLEEAGRDACRFFFALRTPDSHMNFDLELARKRSSENPVYYCQYVHARIASIFREAVKAGLPEDPQDPRAGASLAAGEERALLVKLAFFPRVLKSCAKELSPHPLAGYLMELAKLFHPFYEKRRVVDLSARELSLARLSLCRGVQTVLREGLGLLGVSAPDQM